MDRQEQSFCMRIAVVDDEKIFSEKIEQIIQRHLVPMEYTIVLYNSAEDVLWDLQEHHVYYDIYFIDIEMQEVSGMELAYHIRQKYIQPYIIFVTSHIQYSIKAYEYDTYRYITKDRMQEKIPEVLDCLKIKLSERMQRQYVIENYNRVSKLNYEDIFYIKACGKYVQFYTAQGGFKDRTSLKIVFEKLNSKEFVYVDKGCIVNLMHVLSLDHREIQMRGNNVIVVSEPQYQKVKKILAAFWRGEL